MPISCDTDTMSIDQEVITIDAEVDGWYESFENIANQENEFMKAVSNALWGFLHLKSELIREAENQKTDKNHRKTVKYGSIFEGEIT